MPKKKNKRIIASTTTGETERIGVDLLNAECQMGNNKIVHNHKNEYASERERPPKKENEKTGQK